MLFLDEPTTGFDPGSPLAVWEEVRRMNAAGTTVRNPGTSVACHRGWKLEDLALCMLVFVAIGVILTVLSLRASETYDR